MARSVITQTATSSPLTITNGQIAISLSRSSGRSASTSVRVQTSASSSRSISGGSVVNRGTRGPVLITSLISQSISETNRSGDIRIEDLFPGSIKAKHIANLTITADQIDNATITGDKIAAATITGSNIAAATITGSNIGSATITGSNIASATIAGSNIQSATITGSNIALATITGSNIGAATITGSNIAASTITGSNVAAATITGSNIASATITATNITALTITAAEIANLTITTGKIVDLAITNAKINDIDATKINAGLINVARLNIQGIIMANFTWTNNSPGAGAVAWSTGTLMYKGVSYTISSGNAASGNKYIYWQLGTSNTTFQSSSSFPTLGDDDFLIATNVSGTHDLAFNNANAAQSIVNANVADSTITGTKIATGTITATNITAATITSVEIAAATITGSNIAAATISGSNIGSATISGSNIASATITGSLIASATITGSNVASATITGSNIASATITASNIASATITATEIANLTITAAKIANLTITNGQINDVSASKINTGTLDANVVTVSSADGKMTMSGNILAINNGSGTRQVTLGKYDGTNYGLAIGSNTSSPDAVMNTSGILINATSILQMKSGADILLYNSTNSVSTQIGYVTTQFKITGDSTKGVNIPLLAIGDNNAVSYGGLSDGICITNGSAASSDPSSAIVLWSENGALKYRGSGGARGLIASPGAVFPTTTYSVALEDMYVLADATSGAFTVTLPAASSNECRVIHIKKSDSSGNAVTIGITGGDDIEGSATKSLATQYKSFTLYSSGGARWFIISST